MDAHIQIQHLNAFYGETQALIDVNLEIPRQQITVIMGPSGCGKTTLLEASTDSWSFRMASASPDRCWWTGKTFTCRK